MCLGYGTLSVGAGHELDDPELVLSPSCRQVIRAMKTLRDRGEAISPVSVSLLLETEGELDAVRFATASGEDLYGAHAVHAWAATAELKAFGPQPFRALKAHLEHIAEAEARQRASARILAGESPSVVAKDVEQELSMSLRGLSSRSTVLESAWLTERPQPRDWLLRDRRLTPHPGVLPRGKVGQIVAEGGAGKTMAVVGLALAIATATPWFGTFQPCRAGRVLLLLGEEDQEEVRRRIYHVAQSMGVRSLPEGSIVTVPLAGIFAAILARGENGNPVLTDFARELLDFVRRGGPFDLVVLDPLSRFGGPDAEKDAYAATQFVSFLEQLSEGGATIITSHHTNKASRGGRGGVDGSSGRGSTALFDGVRWQASMSVERIKHESEELQRRLGEIVTFRVTKSNYAKKPDDVALRRSVEENGALVPIDAVDEKTLEDAALARAETPREMARRKAKEGRFKAVCDAILEAVEASPGISTSGLRGAVLRKLGTLSTEAFVQAIETLGDQVGKEREGKTMRHYPIGRQSSAF